MQSMLLATMRLRENTVRQYNDVSKWGVVAAGNNSSGGELQTSKRENKHQRQCAYEMARHQKGVDRE